MAQWQLVYKAFARGRAVGAGAGRGDDNGLRGLLPLPPRLPAQPARHVAYSVIRDSRLHDRLHNPES